MGDCEPSFVLGVIYLSILLLLLLVVVVVVVVQELVEVVTVKLLIGKRHYIFQAQCNK
jgi:hypothetical protein